VNSSAQWKRGMVVCVVVAVVWGERERYTGSHHSGGSYKWACKALVIRYARRLAYRLVARKVCWFNAVILGPVLAVANLHNTLNHEPFEYCS